MRVKIKPADGLKIRRPDTGAHLSEEGAEVKLDTFWKRRISDGDVEIVGESKKAESKKDGKADDKKAIELPKSSENKGAK